MPLCIVPYSQRVSEVSIDKMEIAQGYTSLDQFDIGQHKDLDIGAKRCQVGGPLPNSLCGTVSKIPASSVSISLLQYYSSEIRCDFDSERKVSQRQCS